MTGSEHISEYSRDRRLTDPAQDHIDLHSEQEPVEQHQQCGDAVAQLPQADAMLGVFGKLDGLHDEGQHPVDQ